MFTGAALLFSNAFLRGFIFGIGIAATTALMFIWVLQATGTSPQIMGDLAEQWTAAELRRLRRRGWRLINHFGLRRDDIDHLLIGPGGAYTIETKWSATAWTYDTFDTRLPRAARQAADAADVVRKWARLDHVQPVVFLWGEQAYNLPAVHELMGVTVIAGPHADQWRKNLPDSGLSSDTIKAVWEQAKEHLQRRDLHDESLTNRPPSALDLATTAVITLAVALLGAFLTAALFTLPQANYWGVPAAAGLALAGWLTKRYRPVRLPALGWISGVAATTVAVAADVVVHAIR